MADRFEVRDEKMRAAIDLLSRKVNRPIFPKVMSAMYSEGLNEAAKAYRRVIPVRTGLARRRGLGRVIRKRKGYPYFAALGPRTTGGFAGILIHWTDEGTRVRTRASGGSTGSIPAQNYVAAMIAATAPRVLQKMTTFLNGAIQEATRRTASEMRSASSLGKNR